MAKTRHTDNFSQNAFTKTWFLLNFPRFALNRPLEQRYQGYILEQIFVLSQNNLHLSDESYI